jgi:hypothetical protein
MNPRAELAFEHHCRRPRRHEAQHQHQQPAQSQPCQHEISQRAQQTDRIGGRRKAGHGGRNEEGRRSISLPGCDPTPAALPICNVLQTVVTAWVSPHLGSKQKEGIFSGNLSVDEDVCIASCSKTPACAACWCGWVQRGVTWPGAPSIHRRCMRCSARRWRPARCLPATSSWTARCRSS